MSKEIWPNFFIVGAPRSGTTSLYNYLKCVPGIYMPPVKELNYFAQGVSVRYRRKPSLRVRRYSPVRDQTDYLKLFENVKDEIAVGDATASYLSDPEAAGRIKAAVPEARIIMILRDPVERVYSHYLLDARAGWQRAPFEEAARTELYLEPSMYAKQAQRYLNVFGPDHIKILIFEEFIQDPRKAVREVLTFLGVNAEPPAIVGEVYNYFTIPRSPFVGRILRSRPMRVAMRVLIQPRTRRKIRRQVLGKKANKPPMTETTRRFLEDVFRADVLSLERILDRSLPWFHARGQLTQDQHKRTAGESSHAHR